MMRQDLTRNMMLLLGPAILIGMLFFIVEWRTDKAIQRIAEVCEEAGQGLEIQKISWGGGVEARCMPRADR